MCAQGQSPCMEESPQSSDKDDEVHESSQAPEATERLLDVQSRIPEHMKDMFLQSCIHLTEEQSIEFGEVLIKFGDIFANMIMTLVLLLRESTLLTLGMQAHKAMNEGGTPLMLC